MKWNHCEIYYCLIEGKSRVLGCFVIQTTWFHLKVKRETRISWAKLSYRRFSTSWAIPMLSGWLKRDRYVWRPDSQPSKWRSHILPLRLWDRSYRLAILIGLAWTQSRYLRGCRSSRPPLRLGKVGKGKRTVCFFLLCSFRPMDNDDRRWQHTFHTACSVSFLVADPCCKLCSIWFQCRRESDPHFSCP